MFNSDITLNVLRPPLIALKLAITFSYNLIAVSLSSKETFSSSNLFHRLFLGTVSKDFLNSTKQQKRLDLSLRNSSTMNLSVMRWSVVEFYLLKPAWPLARLPSLSSQMLNLFSKIISYNLSKRGLIIIVRQLEGLFVSPILKIRIMRL